MPTVRSPSSFAARKMRMAISLRLAASNFWMFFGFVIAGANHSSRETLYFHTSGPPRRRSFFSKIYRGQKIPSEGSRHSLGAHRPRRRGFQSLQLRFDLAPLFRFAFGGIGSIGIGEKVQQLRAQIWGDIGKSLRSKPAEQLGMRVIIHKVFARTGEFADIEVIVWQLQAPLALFFQQIAIAVHGGVEAGLEHSLGFRRRCAELQHPQRPNFGKELIQKREEAVPETRPLIFFSPIALVAGARQIIEKLPAGYSGHIAFDIFLLEGPS